jgi:hypothetical protein
MFKRERPDIPLERIKGESDLSIDDATIGKGDVRSADLRIC